MADTDTAKNIIKSKPKHSLNRKSFFITMLLTMGIGFTVLTAGFILYLISMTQEFFINTWNLSNAEAAVIEQEQYRKITDRILDIYDSIPEEERGDGQSEEYKSKFDPVLDDEFVILQNAMRDLQNRNGPMNSFIVAIDQKAGRMIYLVDADKHEKTFCHPGTWENYDQETLDKLVNGRSANRLHRDMGLSQPVQAVITNQPKFGVRCTAGSTMYKTDKYTVMVCVDEKMEPLIQISIQFLIQYLILLAIVTLIASLIAMLLIRRAMVMPINRMAVAAKAYAEDKDKSDSSKHFEELDLNTGDEIENLALTLKDLEDEVADYMENLSRVTAERERTNTELQLASRIQMSMLPYKFPAFPERTEFDIYADSKPAKVVGGDFYDMFMVDDDHLAIEIADVSDKGIPSAIFMAASKLLIADAVKEGMQPSKVLEKVNNRACENNRVEMFVTVWLGILEISSGILTTSNAGHEYPVVVHADGSVEVIYDKHGLVVGGMPDMKYTDFEIRMAKGDRIFVYTDGVTEAITSDMEMFGLDRVTDTLRNAGQGADPEQMINAVRQDINEFVGDAEQFDDMTMLCMEYKG